MSTNINISVGDNKLLAQASLQQNASRQAQLEKEANKRLATQATTERTSANVAAGLNANGTPLTGTRFQVTQFKRRPAANRRNTEDSFIIVANVNADFDDNFELYIKNQNQPDADYKKLEGVADFSFTNVKTAYVYAWRIKESILDSVKTAINNQEIPITYNPPWDFSSTYRQTNNIYLEREKAYTLLMKNVQQNFNANFGQILYGTSNKTGTDIKYGAVLWSADDGEDIVVELDWIETWPT